MTDVERRSYRPDSKADRMRQIADYLDKIDELAKVLAEHAHPMFRELSKGDEMQRDLRSWAAYEDEMACEAADWEQTLKDGLDDA